MALVRERRISGENNANDNSESYWCGASRFIDSPDGCCHRAPRTQASRNGGRAGAIPKQQCLLCRAGQFRSAVTSGVRGRSGNDFGDRRSLTVAVPKQRSEGVAALYLGKPEGKDLVYMG
jgi:hypothetical protein